MDSIWWYIGAGTAIGGIQLVLGIVIGLWIRRGGTKNAHEENDDARFAREYVRELAALTCNVSQDVNRHQKRINNIQGQLGSAKKAGGDSLTALVVGVVGELMRANHELQSQLSSAETELRQQTTEIEKHLSESMTDELTGLPNRRAFEDAISARINGWRHQRVPFTLMMLDIDHFKRVNDEYGHVAGDRVLCTMADAVKKALRKPDFVTRFGGEEFAVLLPYTLLEDAVFAAQKTLSTVASVVTRFEEAELRVTVSAGLASVMEGENATDLVKRADSALYASKNAGRNCGHIHDGYTCSPILSTILPSADDCTLLTELPSSDATTISPELEAICDELRERAAEVADEARTKMIR